MGAVVTKSITVGISDTLVDTAKNSRSYVAVQNLDPTNNVFIGYGGAEVTAGAASNGVRIGPGEYHELLVPGNGSEVRGIAANDSINIVFFSDS